MKKNKFFNIIFSSSACVYDEKNTPPIKETDKLNPKSPYGKTKLKIENMLRKESKSNFNWNIIILRYFNPLGAHPSGHLKEDISKAENIVPNITKVLKNKKDFFKIYGSNYDTRDGTCLRDYIHVVDLAKVIFHPLKFVKKMYLRLLILGQVNLTQLKNCFMALWYLKEIPYKVVKDLEIFRFLILI